MARVPLTPEQKTMVRELPLREKDKLLLRLIAKDELLLEQLSFQHLEHGETVEERHGEMMDFLHETLRAEIGYSPGELMMAMRRVSGYVTRHIRVTKDKRSEVELVTEMLHYGLDEHLARMRRRYRNYDRWHKFAMYVTKRVPTLLRKADKLHPDLWLEVEPKLNELLVMIWDTPELNGEAERQDLPRRWRGGDAV